MMKQLKDFKFFKQQGSCGCYIAVAGMISNFFLKKDYDNLNDFCKEYGLPDIEEETMGSVSEILSNEEYHINIANNIDECVFPKEEEILVQICAQRPLFSLIGKTKPPDSSAVSDYTEEDGHWIAIIGIDTIKGELLIADPSENDVSTVAYDALEFKKPDLTDRYWWQNTSYVGD